MNSIFFSHIMTICLKGYLKMLLPNGWHFIIEIWNKLDKYHELKLNYLQTSLIQGAFKSNIPVSGFFAVFSGDPSNIFKYSSLSLC